MNVQAHTGKVEEPENTPESASQSVTDNDAELKRLQLVYRSLPPERIEAYRRKTNQNPYLALELYAWNTRVSAALFETIGHFEVNFRNTLDQALSERHSFLKRGGDWLDNNHNELSARSAETIEEAREKAEKNLRKDATLERGQVIAELNFSFWRHLINGSYTRTLGGAIMRKYPQLQSTTRSRSDMHLLVADVEPIYTIRNRIAHHEPIFHLSPERRRDDMLRLIRYQSPALADWVEERCRLSQVTNN